MVSRQVVQLDAAAEILELKLEASNSQNFKRELVLEAIMSCTIESLLNDDDFFLEVIFPGCIFSVERDLSFLINFDCVLALRLVILSRSVPIGGPVLIQSQLVHEIIAFDHFLGIETCDQVMILCKKLAHRDERFWLNFERCKIKWLVD